MEEEDGVSGGGVRPSSNACMRWFSCSSSATRLCYDKEKKRKFRNQNTRSRVIRERGKGGTNISMSSNSSRLRWRLRNAAARFLTSLASRLLRPVTSGGTKSFVLTHVRGFFAVEAVVVVVVRFAAGPVVGDDGFETVEPDATETGDEDEEEGTEPATGDTDEKERV